MNKKLRRWILGCLAIVLGLSVLALTRPAAAQPLRQAIGDNVEIVGVIQKIDAGTLTVNGLTIDVSRARLAMRLTVGQAVKVEGTLSGNNNRIVAREVKATEAGIKPGEVEIVGIVQSMNGQQITVNGQTIEITRAEVKSGVSVGKLVKVHLSIDSSGVWTAREVEIFVPGKPGDDDDDRNDGDRAGEFEITGTLEQVGSDFIVVAGQRISTAGAEVKNRLVTGVLVKVHLRVVNGQRVAREVENAFGDDDDDDDSDKPAQVKATSTARSSSSQNSGSGKSGDDGDDDSNDDDHSGNGHSDDDRDDDRDDNSGSGQRGDDDD